MNKQTLADYLSLKKEIAELEKRITVLEVQITNLSVTTVKDKVSGGEGGIQHFEIEGIPLPQIKEKREQLDKVIRKLYVDKNKLENQTREIEQFIHSINSSKARRIIVLRYLEEKSWNEVADLISDNATEDSVRKYLTRFLEKF